MAFVDDISEKGTIHLVKDIDLRDLAVRNMWRGLMLAEQYYKQKLVKFSSPQEDTVQQIDPKIKYDEKVKLIHQACIINKEPVGEKMIERIVVGIKI